MKISPQVNIVGICDVVDNEVTGHKLLIVGMITVVILRMSDVSVGRLVVIPLAVTVFVTMVLICMGGVLNMCVKLISVAVVLSQKRCSREEKQGGKQGLE